MGWFVRDAAGERQTARFLQVLEIAAQQPDGLELRMRLQHQRSIGFDTVLQQRGDAVTPAKCRYDAPFAVAERLGDFAVVPWRTCIVDDLARCIALLVAAL